MKLFKFKYILTEVVILILTPKKSVHFKTSQFLGNFLCFFFTFHSNLIGDFL